MDLGSSLGTAILELSAVTAMTIADPEAVPPTFHGLGLGLMALLRAPRVWAPSKLPRGQSPI